MPDIVIAPQTNGTRPEMPSAPTPEALAMKFEFNPDLLGDKAGETVVKVDKKEIEVTPPIVVKTDDVKPDVTTPVKVDDKKVEPKVEDKPKPSVLKAPKDDTKTKEELAPKGAEGDKKKEVIKPITPVKADNKDTSDQFDYSKYAPQEVVNMKNMSRPSREAYAKLLDENKQLSSLKDATYLQHEQGYTLSPEYNEISQRQYFARTEGQEWEKALLNIRSGKPFRDITGFDANGRPILSEERQPTDRDEIRIQSNLTACSQAVNQITAQLQTYPAQFKQRIQADLSTIQQERNQRFAWVQDPKLLEHSVEIEGRGDVKLKDIKNDFKSIWPSYLANTPGVEVAADLFIAMQIQAAELREARNGQQVAQIKQQEISRGEPSDDNRPAALSALAVKGIPSIFTLDGMPGR